MTAYLSEALRTYSDRCDVSMHVSPSVFLNALHLYERHPNDILMILN